MDTLLIVAVACGITGLLTVGMTSSVVYDKIVKDCEAVQAFRVDKKSFVCQEIKQ